VLTGEVIMLDKHPTDENEYCGDGELDHVSDSLVLVKPLL